MGRVMMASLTNTLANTGLLIATHNQGKLREIQQLLTPFAIDCLSAADKQLPEPVEDGQTFAENAMIKSVAAVKEAGMPTLADDSGLVVPALGGDPGIYSARWAGPRKDFNYAMKSVRIALEAKRQPLDSEAYFVCVLSLALPSQISCPTSDIPKIPPPACGGVREQGSRTGGALPRAGSIDGSSRVAVPPLTSPPQAGGIEYEVSTTESDGIQCINIEGRVYGSLTFPPRGDGGFGYDPIFVAKGMEQTFGEISSDKKQAISHRANAFRGLMEVIGG